MTETGKIFRNIIHTVNHSTYGGEITSFDFEGHPTIAAMGSKIWRDFRFDETCKKNLENRRREHV